MTIISRARKVKVKGQCRNVRVCYTSVHRRIEGGGRAWPTCLLPNLAPTRSRRCNLRLYNERKNPFSGRGSAPIPLGELTVLPRLPSWWGWGWLPPPQEPHPRYRPSGPRASALTISGGREKGLLLRVCRKGRGLLMRGGGRERRTEQRENGKGGVENPPKGAAGNSLPPKK